MMGDPGISHKRLRTFGHQLSIWKDLIAFTIEKMRKGNAHKFYVLY